MNWKYLAGAIALCIGVAGCAPNAEKIETWKSQGQSEKIIPLLQVPEDHLRHAAIEALGDMKAPEAVEPLAALLPDASHEQTIRIYKALDSIGGKEAGTYLLKAAKESKLEQVQLMALKSPATLKADGAKALLISKLGHANSDIALAAAEALSHVGTPDLVEPFSKLVGISSFQLKMVAIQALSAIESEEVPQALAPALGDISPEVRQAAMEAMKTQGSSAVPTLIQVLRKPERLARNSAAVVLEQLNAVPQKGNDRVWYLLAGIATTEAADEAPLQPDVIRQLAGQTEGIEALFAAAAHQDALIRRHAAQALEQMGPAATAQAPDQVAALASTKAKAWYEGRNSWPGGPSWHYDLWGAVAAVNPRFDYKSTTEATLKDQDKAARTLMRSSKFEPARAYIPLLISQMATTEEEIDNPKLAARKLAAAGTEAEQPLLAAVAADDLQIAGMSAELLTKNENPAHVEEIVSAFAQKLEADVPLYDTALYNAVVKLNHPSAESYLKKVEPNKARALQVFNNRFPDQETTVIPHPIGYKEPPNTRIFRVGYLVNDALKQMQVTFKKGSSGTWELNPPLPDELP